MLGLKVPQPSAEPMQTDGPEEHPSTPQHAECNDRLAPEDIAHNEMILARLRQTLQAFEGDRPFHNYTKRQRYTPEKNRPQRWNPRKRSKQLDTTDTASNVEGDAAATIAETADSTDNAVAESPRPAGRPTPQPPICYLCVIADLLYATFDDSQCYACPPNSPAALSTLCSWRLIPTRHAGAEEAASAESDPPETDEEGEEDALDDDGGGTGKRHTGAQEAAAAEWRIVGVLPRPSP